MAVAKAVAQANGNVVRSAMMTLDMDGNATFAIGTVVGATIATSLAGVAVDASTAESYTSVAALTPAALMSAVAADLSAKLIGAEVRQAHNGGDEWVLHIEPIAGVADAVVISTPVFTPA